MNGPALVAARTRLDRTPEQLAAELGIPPHAYAACEAGRASLSRRHAELITYQLAVRDRQDALAASGLPACQWMERWGDEIPEARSALEAHVARAEAHASGCATCGARDAFLAERFPTMPPVPMAGWARALQRLMGWVDARPEWLRPALLGAAALAALTAIRVVLVLPAALREPRVLLAALGAVVAASAAGAFGGLVYALLGRPLRRVPVVGPYLAGMVAVAGYLLAILTMVAIGDRDTPRDLASDALFLVLLSALLGAFVGHRWLRAPLPGRSAA
ncbi:hypothetical protein [Roseisolibacter agri]|uniref:Uncharacterized protein n=1 Tax=Roseisolibacter agri TaxID=2014610 RepID=A0AA37QC49_9BACT|nr:hypothetical protein [Roseisolibacter agri]GLC23550.1 hypothetical protein rosag_00630 [Roseisolibacter agri]